MKTYAIILASGTGNRFGGDLPKQFTEIAGKTILERSIEVFEGVNGVNGIDSIILVITPEYKELAEEIVKKNNYKKVSKIIEGGKLRKDSSYNGVFSIEENEANILIHDCARPFISADVIKNCIKALETHNAVGVAIPSTDTIIEVNNEIIKNIPPRDTLMRVQTPQCFKLSLIKKAHELSKNDTDFTDDCGLVLKHNLADIFVVKGNRENIKITYPEDIILANIYAKGSL
ncbi:2-C-methyl-D-erythritol 4-phosphate cytidylyltransferase [bacterium]|nr:2-C-methyl-D-erythritol 4-phosphate cytidylyltransferase [bacterium]